nr:hypothetical protein [Tanacetum cinerariifolium]
MAVAVVLSFTTASKLARWNLSFFKLEFTMLTLGSSFGTSTMVVLEEILGSLVCTEYRDQKACSADNSVCAFWNDSDLQALRSPQSHELQ